ncbi:hypothetical protein QTI79_04160 [Clostridium perfringens]|nr:hypothetical protein [Clostridium perfringens]
MSNIAIVVIGYNRPNSMQRLLNSLKVAEYYLDDVPLIISIDNSGSNNVKEVAEKFIWPYGKKTIKTYNKRLGLKKHILECGKYTLSYKNIIVLEDDIYVSPVFYKFAKEAVEFYKNNKQIAGISLYSHACNVVCNRPFSPIADRYDTYFMKFAQSWGQVWMKESWNEFINWLNSEDSQKNLSNEVPESINNWPETSWLKYHIKYLVDKNKYFVYPRKSLTTNFTDIGQHAKLKSTAYQVEIELDSFKKFYFAPFDSFSVKYDVYFENEDIYKKLKLEKNDLCVDFYGAKKNKTNCRYWLTTNKENYKIIKKYSLSLRPQDLNVLENINGNDIFLYDTTVQEKNVYNNKFSKLEYDFKAASKEQLLKLSIYYYIQSIKEKIKSLIYK